MFEFGRAVLQVINHFLQDLFARHEPPPSCATPPEHEPPRPQDEQEQPYESPEPEDKPSTHWRDHVTQSRPENWMRELQRWLPQEQEQQRDGQEQEHDQG